MWRDSNSEPERAPPQNPEVRAKYIEVHRLKMHAHPFYSWLESNSHFCAAQKRFDYARNRSRQGPMLSEFADFRFVRIVALYVGSFWLFKQLGIRSSHATKRQARQAKGYAKKLREIMSAGVRLRDSKQQNQLNILLKQLEMEIESAPRKEKEDKTFEQRKCVEQVAFQLQSTFGKVLPSILSEIAGMVDWLPDMTTIDRVAKKGRVKWRGMIVKALRAAPQKTP
jgi:hypothetical protein